MNDARSIRSEISVVKKEAAAKQSVCRLRFVRLCAVFVEVAGGAMLSGETKGKIGIFLTAKNCITDIFTVATR